MSMGESHEHGRTTCAYGGVNGVNFRVIAQSSALGSSLKLFNLVSPSIDSLFPSFRIHGIVVINHLPSSPFSLASPSSPIVSNHPHRSSVQCRTLSLAQWISPIRMKEPHAHMRESTESTSASALSLLHASFSVSFWSPSASSLIQSYSVTLNLRHFASLILVFNRLD
jgi:hypothetical protein